MDPATALGAYLELADAVAPGLVEGLYVVGSYALGDWVEHHSDIDVVMMTAEPATDDDFGALRTVHALLSERQPRPFIDGPYLAWGDLVVEPATGLHRPWTLDGELHHDGDCFEINPVTWYTLARYGVTVRGAPPERIGIAVDTQARIRFVVDNLRGYWSGVADEVAVLAAAEPDRRWQPSALEWCGLGALRLHYTAFTGDVISKRAAGEYGLEHAPNEFHGALRRAMAIRVGDDATSPTSAEMTSAARLIAWTIDDVRAAAG